MADSIPLKVQVESSPGRKRGLVLHVLRVVLFFSIVGIIHLEYREQQQVDATEFLRAMRLEQVREYFPRAESIKADGEIAGAVGVYDEFGDPLGYMIETAPQSDEVVGYAGPTDMLLVFNSKHRLMDCRVLQSDDTREYVERIIGQPDFFKQFKDESYEELGKIESVDAVSGATLTSQAIAQSIAIRLSGNKPSLRFPRELTIEDVKETVPEAVRLVASKNQPLVYDLYDAEENHLGSVTRTSPVGDEQVGYNGPTDTKMLFGDDGKLKQFNIRDTFETPKYADYVREDEWFHGLFEGKTVEEIAALDAGKIEGVSGATMTSQTMARAMIDHARQLRDGTGAKLSRGWIQVSIHDVMMLSVIVFAMLMAWTRLKRFHKLRMVFQLILIGYVGVTIGHLISLKALVGWSQSGLPYQSAVGLVALGLAALLVPVFSRTHFYCHQICPYGAAQERIKHISPFKYKLPKRVHHALLLVPFLILVAGLMITLEQLPVDVANLEPFAVFNYQVAGVVVMMIAGVGLVFSFFVPMGFCRYACPTGTVLGYLRFNAKSGEFSRRDVAALWMLLIAVVCKWMV